MTCGTTQTKQLVTFHLSSTVQLRLCVTLLLPVYLLFPVWTKFLPHQLITQNSTNSRLLLSVLFSAHYPQPALQISNFRQR